MQEAEIYGAPEGMHREIKKENPYKNYVDLLYDIVDKEPSTYEEVSEKRKNGKMP